MVQGPVGWAVQALTRRMIRDAPHYTSTPTAFKPPFQSVPSQRRRLVQYSIREATSEQDLAFPYLRSLGVIKKTLSSGWIVCLLLRKRDRKKHLHGCILVPFQGPMPLNLVYVGQFELKLERYVDTLCTCENLVALSLASSPR